MRSVPRFAGGLAIPYTIFQGIYSTKRKRRIRTLPGYLINTAALKCATHVFANKRIDFLNLKRIVSENRLTYVAPGIVTDDFRIRCRCANIASTSVGASVKRRQ